MIFVRSEQNPELARRINNVTLVQATVDHIDAIWNSGKEKTAFILMGKLIKTCRDLNRPELQSFLATVEEKYNRLAPYGNLLRDK